MSCIFPRAVLTAAVSAGLICAAPLDPASAQTSWSIQNISPASSDRDASDPNSASGGRVNKLSGNPRDATAYFAASEWGGLFRTTDAGRNWTYVPGHRPQAVWDVEYDPSDPSRLIATSLFDGKTVSEAGINRSTDGGVTWSVPATARPAAGDCEIARNATEPGAYGIAYDPADPRDIYVGTECGLAISTDRGATWRYVDPTPGDGGGLRVADVIVHDNGIVDICGDEGHMRSTDGGATFDLGGTTTTEEGGMCSLAVSPDEPDTLFMSVGTRFLESRDAGATWRSLGNPGPQGRIPFVRVNDRTGAGYDLYAGDTQLWRASCTTPASPNSTAARCPASGSWTTIQTGGHWDVGDVAFDPTRSVDACPILFSNDGGVYFNQTTGSGCHTPTWEQPQQGVTALWLWDMDGNIRAAAGEEGVYTGQQDSGGFGTREAASTPDWNAPNCCDIFDVEAEDARVIYTVCCFSPGRATQMFLDDMSMDGGTQINTYPPGNLVGFRDTDSLTNYAPGRYAVVTSSGVFFTTDIAAATVNWQTLGTGAPIAACGILTSRRADGTPVFYLRAGPGTCGRIGGGVGSLWRHDGASTGGAWVEVRRNGNAAFGVVGIDPSDPDHIIANDMAGTAPQMVRSVNGGDTWTAIPALDALLQGNGDFLAQVQSGATGSGYAQASMVQINPGDRNMIVVGGQDSGVFLTANGGTNWSLLTDPRNNATLRPHISRPLFAHFEPRGNGQWNLYVGARGRGVWRVGLDFENRWAGAIWRHTGQACSGQSCPGWRRLDNNVRTAEIAASGNALFQLHMDGSIWRSTGTPCSGESCPGWQRLDNNPRTVAIATGGGRLYQLHGDGRIWLSTGQACAGQSCPGWRMLDNNRGTVAIAAAGNELYQLHRDGRIWRHTGTACSGQSCPGWRLLDNNPATVRIVAEGDRLYQMHQDGRIWRHTGTACSGQSCPGWQMLDNNPMTADISANGEQLFQRHRDGRIWRFTGTVCSGQACPGWRLIDNNPRGSAIEGGVYQMHHDGRIWESTGQACSGASCPGWRMLDNNPRTREIEAAEGSNDILYQLHGPHLFQVHDTGAIWQSTGLACSGSSCPGWQRLDNNSRTIGIAAGAGRLFQLHRDGRIWRSNGRPCIGDSCPGWELLDNNARTRKIVTSAGQLFQLHRGGDIWRFTGTRCNGDSCPGWERLDNNSRTDDIVSGGGQLYQRHRDGRIWRWTGRPCAGDSCPGWVMLDNNARTRAIAAADGVLYQLHEGGRIWRHTGRACTGESCPGWTMLDNNSRTSAIAAGGHELYQLHTGGAIWQSLGRACSGESCPGWQRLDNNPRAASLTAGGGLLYQLHDSGAAWRSTGTPCQGTACPGWQRLDNNSRTRAIVATD